MTLPVAERDPDRSTKPARDVILGLLVLRFDKDGVGDIEFDQFAHIHIGGIVGDPGGLLHVVGDDQDGDLVLEVGDQFFDAGGCDRVQRGSRFVE